MVFLVSSLLGGCRSESVVTDLFGASPPVDPEQSTADGGRSSGRSPNNTGGSAGAQGGTGGAGGQSGQGGQSSQAGSGAAGMAGEPTDAAAGSDPETGAAAGQDGGSPMGGAGGAMPPASNPDTGSAPQRALLVVGPGMPVGTDAALRDRLAMRFTVDVVADADSATANADGKALVVISGSVDSMTVGTKFRDVAVPVMLLEVNLMDTMGLTGAPASQHGSSGAMETQIAIVASNHPLAAGLSGNVTVYSMPGRLAWGVPANSATSVATVVGTANQRVIFAYDKGAMMVSGTAAARRLGYFIRENPINNLGLNALTLLDAAVAWLTEQP